MSHQWHNWHGLECCRVCGIVRRRDDKNTPCKGPTRVGPRGEPAYGWNDATTVYCGFCDWKKVCASMEQMEHELRQHVLGVHGKHVRLRQENETGREVDIP